MPTSLDLTAWSGEAGGYHLVRGLFLPAHSLGAVDGDDAHCRAVCAKVGGCNTVSRLGGSRRCYLDGACPGGDRQLQSARQDGGADAAGDAPSPTLRAVQRRT